MASTIADQPDGRPWLSREAARKELESSAGSARLLRFLEWSGFFAEHSGPRPREVRAALHALAKALEDVAEVLPRLPAEARQVLEAARALNLADLADRAPSSEQTRVAAAVALEISNRNEWPRPQPRELALAAIACGLDRPIADGPRTVEFWEARRNGWSQALARCRKG